MRCTMWVGSIGGICRVSAPGVKYLQAAFGRLVCLEYRLREIFEEHGTRHMRRLMELETDASDWVDGLPPS